MVVLRIVAILGVIIGAIFAYLLIVAFIPGFRVRDQRLQRATGRPKPGRDGHRREVSFPVGGTNVSAWLYLPDIAMGPVPCIVMAHGLGATKDAGLEAYAVRFREAGFAVLAFDYRCLGTRPPGYLARLVGRRRTPTARLDPEPDRGHSRGRRFCTKPRRSRSAAHRDLGHLAQRRSCHRGRRQGWRDRLRLRAVPSSARRRSRKKTSETRGPRSHVPHVAAWAA